jgi:hypothetical protein
MGYPKTDDFLNQCLATFSFDGNTGEFMEPKTKGSHSWLEPAGRTTSQGVRLTIGNYEILAHHLAWRILHGEWPSYHVKHLNKDCFDNRPENLHAPGKEKHDKKKKGSTVPFLRSLGYSQNQINRHAVEVTRERFGERAALDVELKFGLITQSEHAEQVAQLDN